MIRFIRTLFRLHKSGNLEQTDILFFLTNMGALLICLYLLELILWVVGTAVYGCWQSPDCRGGR